jgi:DNA-binding MarR family transcriptional regulator
VATRSSHRGEALFAAIEGLGRLSELLERRRQQLAREVGLSPQQWRVLEEIGREDFMPSLFARSRECAPAAVSRTLRQLLERGLVEVSIASADARRRDYALTPAGRDVLARLRAARERALEAVWSGLDREELARFADFGSRLADRLEAYARSADAPGPGEGTGGNGE